MWHVSRIVVVFILVTTGAFGSAPAPTPLLLSYEERAVMAYLLAGVGKSDDEKIAIAELLEKQLRESQSKATRQITISDFSHFPRYFQGNWPDSYSVASDIDLLEQRRLRAPISISGETLEVQSRILEFHAGRAGELIRRLGPTLSGIDTKIAAGGLAKFFLLTPRRDMVLRAFSEAEAFMNEEFSKIQGIGEMIAKTDKLQGLSPEMKAFLSQIFKEYFTHMSPETKALVTVRLMGQDLNLDPMKKFEIMILSGGPQFQKLLQVVAREANLSPDLLEIFRRLESKAPPVPAMIVQDMIERERGTYDWMKYDLKPLGVGTMAQVHKGRIRTSQGPRDVVIRFLKPDIEKRVNEDHRILSAIAPKIDADPVLRAAGFPLLTPIVSDLTKTVREELSLRETIVRQIRGREVYTKKGFFGGSTYKNDLFISVPEIYDYDRASSLMVQDLVIGKKLDSVAEQYKQAIPDLKKVIVEELARMWVEELTFKSGFFHADMHQGNFMIEMHERGLRVNILDFGMGGTISREMQSQILLLGAGIEILKPSAILHALWSISDQTRNQITRPQLEARVKVLVRDMDQGRKPLMGVGGWATWAMENGLQFPYEFIGMNRGLAILDKLLQDSGSKFTMAALSRQAANAHAARVWTDLKASGEMSTRDILRLGWLAVTNSSPATIPYREVQPQPRTTPMSSLKCSRVLMPATGAL